MSRRPKRPKGKKRKREDVDADMQREFGVKMTKRKADAFRCLVCKGLLIPSQSGNWLCRASFCGPIVPVAAIQERLIDSGHCPDAVNILAIAKSIRSVVRKASRKI